MLPLLGHSTWHLYRKVVEPGDRTAAQGRVPLARHAQLARHVHGMEQVDRSTGRLGQHDGEIQRPVGVLREVRCYQDSLR